MATTSPSAFGALLRQYRLAAGVTQGELAARAGLSERGVSDLERGVKRPRRVTVRLLAQALGLAPPEQDLLRAAVHAPGSPTVEGLGRARHPQGIGPPLAGVTLSPLVGRADEVAFLEEHLAGGGPPLVLLAGEPGIGKSRLLGEAIQRAADHGWAVLAGSCQRRGQEPYAPLLQALEGHFRALPTAHLRSALRGCAWLVRLLPELASGPIDPLPALDLVPEQERRLLFGAVARYLTNVAGPAGTLLVLDDLHWAGADALDLLSFLVRSADPPARVLGAYRNTDVCAQDALPVALADLAQARLAWHHVVGALSAREAAELLDNLLADTAEVEEATRERLLRRAEGVPFVLVSGAQALRLARARGSEGDAVPWDVAHGIRQRVAHLPPIAQEVLAMAALVGREATPALLTKVTKRSEDEILSALDAAYQVGLLTDQGVDSVRFAHDVIREVVEADVGTARRRVLHRRVATALEEGPLAVPAEALAYHYGRGDDPDKAVLYLERAGDVAESQRANATALEYYREALVRLDRMGRHIVAARVREKLGTLLEVVGDYAAAQSVLEEAVALYRAVGEADRLGHALEELGWVYSGRLAPRELIARLRPEVEPLEAAGPSVGLVGLCTMLAFFYGRSGQYGEQLAMAERARASAEQLGDTYALLLAQQRQGMALLALGREAEALRVMEELIPLAEAADRPVILCTALLIAGAVYEQRGEFERRRQGLARVLEINERREARVWLPSIMADGARVLFLLGDWPEARRRLEVALALGRAVNLAGCVAPPLLELGRLCLAEGAWTEACHHLDEAIGVATAEGDLWRLRAVHSVRAECELLMGQADRACERLTPLLDGPALREWGVQMVVPVLAWALLECGDGLGAQDLLVRGIARARSRDDRLTLVDLLRVQALVEQGQGRWPEADEALEEGLALARRLAYPYAEGRLLHVSGTMHAQMGAPEAASELLTAAVARFRQLGAAGDADQAERALAELAGARDCSRTDVSAGRSSA